MSLCGIRAETRMISWVKLSFVWVVPDSAKVVDAGTYHSMVLKQDGSVWATGRHTYGDGSATNRLSFVQDIARGVKSVVVGSDHNMELKRDDSVWATGSNKFGQLGDRSTIVRSDFIQVVTIGAQSVAARGVHSVVRCWSGDRVWTTGGNPFGQLGVRSTTSKSSFVVVESINDGAAQAWGLLYWTDPYSMILLNRYSSVTTHFTLSSCVCTYDWHK